MSSFFESSPSDLPVQPAPGAPASAAEGRPTSELLGYIRTWLEQNPPQIPFKSITNAPPPAEAGFVPIGGIVDYGGSADPDSGAYFFICDGRLLNQADHPDLYTAIGAAFNTGGESGTQFRIPDLQERVTAGYKGGSAEFGTIGQSGGEKTHLNLAAESGVPQHFHTQHTATVYDAGAAVNFASGTFGAVQTRVSNNDTQLNAAANAASAHNNLPPYLTTTKIIRHT